jgi:type I restriction enzyme M protein
MELVPETYRLALMNLSLHGIHSGILMGDCLSTEGTKLGQASVVLTNPPFGSKKGAGRAMRPELKITHASGNKQLSFLEHAALSLREGGRAAVVVPDNVLFEDNVGRRLRTWLLKYFNVHTILRLPLGIFYAQGVKTNVLFFNKLPSGSLGTQRVWVYDLRTGVPPFGRTKALQSQDLAAFETAFGDDRFGEADRQDQGANGRFRCFTREDIAARNDSLDLGWLVEEEMSEQHQSDDPAEIVAALALHLRRALDCVEALSADFSDGVPHAE